MWVWLTGQKRPRDGLELVLTHWGRDKMAAIFVRRFQILLYKKTFVLWFTFHLNLLPIVWLTICQQWFRWWLGSEQATSHYLNQWWTGILTPICATRLRGLTLKVPVEPDPNLAIPVPANGLVSLRTEAYFVHFISSPMLRHLWTSSAPCTIFQSGRWDLAKSHDTSRVNSLGPSDAYMRQ